jgi:hypothetical protein
MYRYLWDSILEPVSKQVIFEEYITLAFATANTPVRKSGGLFNALKNMDSRLGESLR